MNWYLEPWKKYAQFTGRARRTEYWTFTLINILIGCLLFLFGIISSGGEHGGVSLVMLLYWAFALASLIPSLACGVRRLHDTSKSGWWLLIVLVPLVGGIILIVLLLLDGTPGDNLYGPNPRAA
ncbi:MAG: DUF805 domain-containing protein [Terracidiphilus sp.]